jgi:hypothetical protein
VKPKPFIPSSDGAQEKPKFERDNLEGQSSGNHLKENPEVLSRLGFRQEAKKASVLAAKLRNRERVKPGTVEWEYKIRKEFVKNTENTSSRKVIANTERTTERFNRRKLSWKVQGKGRLERTKICRP